jgi:hypothetical protein
VRKWGIRGFELMGLGDMEDTKGNSEIDGHF